MKKKKFDLKVLFTLVVLCIIALISGMEVYAEGFTSLNPVIDVGDKIYVKHDENNNNIYDLQKSGTGITTVYEPIFANFTGSKAWTIDGKFMDTDSTTGATSPQDYIQVKEGEQYFIKAYGIGYGNGIWYTTVLFMDDENTVVGYELKNTLSASKAGVTITVPKDATRMHLSDYNHQDFTLQKVLNLTDEEFDQMTMNRAQLEADINETYEQYKKDRTLYKKLDKAYITFVNDDTRAGVDAYADLFISKNVPLVLATVPQLLIENDSSGKEMRLEAARRVESAGGEIMAHNPAPLTQEGFSDYNTMYSFFVRTKQMFNYYGFDVNGIILSGGTGQVTGAEESEKWASSLYSYSDLYGVEYNKKEIALDSVYYHYRSGLLNYQNDLDKVKKTIDDAIENQKWIVFYFHDENDVKTEILSQILDYVNTKNEDELEVVTYKEMYQKNAVKESEAPDVKNTYYVADGGTSTSGTNIKHPISYETAKKKTFLSGDTILFRKGDTFYGTFNPNVSKVDDKVTTISSYGEGDMPVISAYKFVDSESAWYPYESIEETYVVDLKNPESFSGLPATDNASCTIEFLEDENGQKIFSKKSGYWNAKNEYDYYGNGWQLFIKSDTNPYLKSGKLKLATRNNLLILQSNLTVENIRFCGAGASGLTSSGETIKNVNISNNIIEDIGGSKGNGIELCNADVSDITIKDNIIRNVYGAGVSIQSNDNSAKNVVVTDNVFVNNFSDSEIRESGNAEGTWEYEFANNISVNAGRGWGYEARSDQYSAAHILFEQSQAEEVSLRFHDNIVYNPIRLYYAEDTNGTDTFFKETEYISSDHNIYFLTNEASIFNDSYAMEKKDDFIAEYGKDAESTFSLVEVDESVIHTAVSSNVVKTIKKLFRDEPDDETGEEAGGGETESGVGGNIESETGEESNKDVGKETDAGTGTGTGEKPAVQETAMQAGEEFTDTKNGAVYRIKQPGAQNGTVEYVKCTNVSSKTIMIPSTITYENVTYKVIGVAANALKGNKKVTNVVIGANVTTINSKAFYKCTALKKVTIPVKVNKIGAYAFYGCKNLKTLTIKTKQLTSKNVGKKAFSGIYKKAKIKVPASKKKAYKKWLRKKGVPSKAAIK